MVDERIVEFAKQKGYETAVEAGEWNGYKCYEPIYSVNEPVIIGLPLMILENEDGIRWSTYAESQKMLEEGV